MSSQDRHFEALKRQREPAMQAARALLAKSDYLGAIATIRKADGSINGLVATARLLESHLQQLVARVPAMDRDSIRTAFAHAWRIYHDCYPDPHTRMEADDFDRGRSNDYARLVKIVGFDPTK